MPRNTILSEGIVNFGKYKEKKLSGIELVQKDPAYVYWCERAGVARLDADVKQVVNVWAMANKAEANRVANSAVKVARENGFNPDGNFVEVPVSKVFDAKEYTPKSAIDPAWGSW